MGRKNRRPDNKKHKKNKKSGDGGRRDQDDFSRRDRPRDEWGGESRTSAWTAGPQAPKGSKDRDRSGGPSFSRSEHPGRRDTTDRPSGGGFVFRDRSGKVHTVGDRDRARADGSRGAEPEAPTSRARDFQGSEERVYRPRPESEVVAKPARGRKPDDQRNRRAPSRGGGGLIKLKASVDKNRKGFGFLSFENRQYEDAFVPPREAESLFHGDRVEVTISSSGEVHQIKVLEHRFREMTGRYMPHAAGPARGGWVVYERKKAREQVFVPDLKGHKPEEGDWLRAKLVFHEEGPHTATAEIVELYGKDLPPSADVGMIANEYNLVEEHPAEAEREAREKKLEIPGRDLEGREDLRNVPFITIDGETARDFDDAVYVERKGGGFVLWVAIADVSHYVHKDSALDKSAFSRATSVYFPERAFHMLPRALSENLCSLRPDEPRLTMTARMEFDSQGIRKSIEVMESVIQSRRRATYNEIQAEWEANRDKAGWEFAPHFALYQLIRKQRAARGSIDFDLPEAELKVDPNGEVISIKNRARVDAHRLIEEFMIAANEGVTDWAMERGWPFVYRVHDVPAMQALEKFQALAANVGVDFSIGDASPKVMAELVKRLEGHPAQELLNTALLRSMKQAAYSSVHGIHFGLASEGYTHFTSPIRRYPDLLVHRVLRRAVRVEKGIDKPLDAHSRQQLEDDLAEACEHCSYRERLAADAERDSIKLKQVRLMSKHLGDEFEGKINGMTENGMFVLLDDPFVEGMIHKDRLDDDFYQFDDQHMIFFGKRKRRTFRMGDRLKVKVARADIDLRMVDFELLEGGAEGAELPPGVGRGTGKDRDRGRDRDRDRGRGGGSRGRGGAGKPERDRKPKGAVPGGSWGGGGLGRADQRSGHAPPASDDDRRPRKGKHGRKGKKR
jgi:ribonuclease R